MKFELPATVAERFKVVNTTSPILESRIGRIDFRTITLEQAEALVERGSLYLIKKAPPKAAKKQRNS